MPDIVHKVYTRESFGTPWELRGVRPLANTPADAVLECGIREVLVKASDMTADVLVVREFDDKFAGQEFFHGLGQNMKSDGLSSDMSLVSVDWDRVKKLDIYTRDHRKIGGAKGWKVDVAMIEAIVVCMDCGAAPYDACMVVGLPWKLFKRWLRLGKQLAEDVFDKTGRELSDEEEGYLWMYRTITHAEGLWKQKSALVVDQTLAGNPGISKLQAQTAMQVLARRSAANWERKSGVRILNEQDEDDDEPVAALGSGNRFGDQIVIEPDEVEDARGDRDTEIEQRRRRKGTLGDLKYEE